MEQRRGVHETITRWSIVQVSIEFLGVTSEVRVEPPTASTAIAFAAFVESLASMELDQHGNWRLRLAGAPIKRVRLIGSELHLHTFHVQR